MKILFMGTPDFAVKTLEACLKHHEVLAVFTQPDKPKGRGNKLTAPPIKEVSNAHQLPVFQPEKIRKGSWADDIRAINPDVIVVVAYGQLLSKEILDIPRYGCINVHASLLPKYRGAAPINWAIVHGEKKTGITTMQMDVGLDTGDMLLKREVEITDRMNAQELHDILSIVGADLLIETLDALALGTCERKPQDHDLTCYAPMMNKTLARIDWQQSAIEIDNRVRGFYPWPIAHTTLNGETLKVYEGFVLENTEGSDLSAGSIVKMDKKGIVVQTGKDYFVITELQLGSNKRMTAQAFLLGKTIDLGTKLE